MGSQAQRAAPRHSGEPSSGTARVLVAYSMRMKRPVEFSAKGSITRVRDNLVKESDESVVDFRKRKKDGRSGISTSISSYTACTKIRFSLVIARTRMTEAKNS